MKSQMKLKYTLVFTIISFFITTAGFSQQYSDQEIGFDAASMAVILKKRSFTPEAIGREINYMREKSKIRYQEVKKIKDQISQKTTAKQKSNSNKSVAVLDIPQTEKDALKLLYDSTNGDNWTNKNNWDFSTPVTSWDYTTKTGWYGVEVENGHVVSLYLRSNNLTNSQGPFPNISALTYLAVLDLTYNNLSGGLTNFQYLTSLKALTIGANPFDGTLAPLSTLVNLEGLTVWLNVNITGPIPEAFYDFTNLKMLEIQQCYGMSGTISPKIGNLQNLEYLSLLHTDLAGNIPDEIGNLKKLKRINFANLGLTGTIPLTMEKLTNLEDISIILDNGLQGTIPLGFEKFTKLRNFEFAHNNLHGKFPDVSNCINLQSVRLEGNKFRFADFADQHSKYSATISPDWYLYAPQDKTDTPKTITPSIGSSITLKMYEDDNFVSTETFQWYKGNGQLIQGATSREYTISNLRRIDAGSYYCIAKHPQISLPSATGQSLVLEREPITLEVVCPEILDIDGEIIVDQQAPTTNQTIAFSFTTTATDISWYSWTFYNPNNSISGYGSSSTAKNYFTYEGTCKAKLEVTTLDGCKKIFEKNITVVKPPCVIVTGAIKTSVENITANQDFKFSLETNNVGYLWYKWTYYNADGTVLSSEDGSNSTGNKYYPLPGNYRVNLVVRDSYDCTTSFDKIITIAPQNCPPLTGTIQTTSTTLLAKANTRFYFESPSANLNYVWTFYDLNNNVSETSEGNYVIKSFDSPGNYRVNLSVKEQNRCTTSIDKTVTVTQGPVCTSSETGTLSIGENNTIYANTNNELYFETNTDQDLHYKWTIYNPDNTINNTFISDENYISNLNFATVGDYKAVVEITDMSGCTATFNKTFTVIYDCRINGMIKDINNVFSNDDLKQVLVGTKVTVLFNFFNPSISGRQFSWNFLNPSGAIVATGSGDTFDVTPQTLGDYKIEVTITDPTTTCVNNFSAILPSVDECRMSDKNRTGYITINGEYAYSGEAMFLDINQTMDVGIYRPPYDDLHKTYNLEWSLYNPQLELISTGNQPLFPIALTTPGFYKVVVKVIDPDTGCSTDVTRAFSSQIQNSCTQTNERSEQVRQYIRALTKKLILRSVNGETDAQINAGATPEEFTALKPFILNSPKDKIYNFKTARNRNNTITTVDFSFSPDREYDVHISIQGGLFTEGYDPGYILYLIDSVVYVDINQYVSSGEFLASCRSYQNGRLAKTAKTILDPKDCAFSSEIKNIDFCPPACVSLAGDIKTSTQEIFTKRNTTFFFETTATDLTYKWTFYNLGNEDSTIYTTNSVDKRYIEQGNYDIKLEITDPATGCLTTFDKTIAVTVNPNCAAISGAIQTSTPDVFVGRSTNFSFETTATDLSYKWTFTQGSESTVFTSKTVDYTYLNPGTNNVILEVTDSEGCTTTIQKLVVLKTGSSLCDDVTQFGRAFIQVGNDTDLFKAARINVNEITNITFPVYRYGPGADFTYKWSLLNENDQLVDSGTNLDFPITPTNGGFYKVVLDLKEYTTGCTHQFTRSIVCSIPNSCAETNPQSSVVKDLVVNLLKNLISRSMMGETDREINASASTSEFNALKPYITSGPKDKIYNFTTTRNLGNEFTSVSFSLSPDRTSDIYISIPHYLSYQQGMSVENDLLPLIESKIHIDLSQYVSANQYLISCYNAPQFTAKSLLKPNDCELGSEIRYIDFCPNECDALTGVIKMNTENPSVNTGINFSLEAAATGLTYNWTFYNADNTVKESQASAIPTQNYTIAGTYKVNLVVTDNNNCNSTFTKTINISPVCVGPTGTIKTTSPNIFAGVNNDFFFETTETDLTYDWTIYNNVNGNTYNYTTDTINAYYNNPGNYNVKLVVTNANGCTSIFRTTAIVKVKPPCATIAGDIKTVNPIIYTNENTTFSFETTATNLTYNWTFHSLNNTPLLTTTQSNPTVVYPYANDYKVSLTVTDENNCYTTIEKYITVKVKHICSEIVGTIKTSTEKIKTNNSTVFSLQTAATNIAYKWIFYNTNSVEIGTATTSTAEWTYTTPGDYLVELVITDQYSCITKLSKTVKVTEPVECTPIVGTIKMDTETPFLFTYTTFSFETTATDLTYTWNLKIPENSGYYNDPRGGNAYQVYLQYGEGDYTILLDVKDSNDCVTHFEKIFRPTYDCRMNSVTGIIYNRSHSNYYSPQVLINKPNEFTFWPYSMWNLSDLTLNWELTKLDDTPITTFTGETFVFTPTTSDNLKLKLTIRDRNNCPHYFERELQVTEACEFSGEDLSGSIAFENEDNAEVSTIQINQTKELGFRPDREITRSYTYKWEIYNANDELVDSGNQEKHLLTLTTAGFYKVNVAIENEAGCILNFTKPINCLIQNSCTNENPKSEIVKNIYLNVLKNLISRSLTKETDEHINASRATDEFEALKPYITNGTKDKIYNYTTARDEQGRLISVRFSFSPDRDYDVQILLKKGLWNFDSDYDGTLTQFSANIAAEIYMDLSQYTSSDNYLISCYVQNAQQSSVPNPENPPTVQRAQKTKKLSKISLNTNDCYKESEIRYIDFCPAQVCKPTVGVIQSGFGLANPSRPDKNSKKSGSKL